MKSMLESPNYHQNTANVILNRSRHLCSVNCVSLYSSMPHKMKLAQKKLQWASEQIQPEIQGSNDGRESEREPRDQTGANLKGTVAT